MYFELSFDPFECFMNEPNIAPTVFKFYVSTSEFHNLLYVSIKFSFKNLFENEWKRIDVLNSIQQRHLLTVVVMFMFNKIKLAFHVSFLFESLIQLKKKTYFQ